MFLAFPRVLASSFSGFYLAMWLLVWSLMLRGISIEVRSHIADGLWRRFWDGMFFVSSAALPLLLGVALGNILRGVPLRADGWFELPLFASFTTTGELGLLDWYTMLVGLFALVVLGAHGASFLAWKTDGAVEVRSRAWARRLWLTVLPLWGGTAFATYVVTPSLITGVTHRPMALTALAITIAGFVVACTSKRQRRAFIGSATFVLGILALCAASLFPTMVASSEQPALSLTAFNASASQHGLVAALKWWLVAFPIVLGYLAMLFYLHRGKTKASGPGSDEADHS